MIELNQYNLTASELKVIEQLLTSVGTNPSLEQLWQLMDQVWLDCGCNNQQVDEQLYSYFYSHPIWLLNGIFFEQDDVSMGHRQAITASVTQLSPERIVDFGGGFGTLARLMATALPTTEIDICEPYPPRYGLESCRLHQNIHFVPKLLPHHYDVLVSTDVLEHVPDPLALLADMTASVKQGGHLIIANCFYPVIKCHLPSTFHFRHSFDRFCGELGLDRIDPCKGSHATIYCRNRVVIPDWVRLRRLEQRSQILFSWLEWEQKFLAPWKIRFRRGLRQPLYYPKKLLSHFKTYL